MKLFDLAVSGERAAIVDDLRIVAEGRADGFRNVRPGHADAQRLGGLDGGNGVVRQAGHGPQPVRPGGEDARRRAEDVEQARGDGSGVAAGIAPRQQELQQFAVVDGLAPGAQEPALEPAAAGGFPDRGLPRTPIRGRRCGHVEQGHVAEARFGGVERRHSRSPWSGRKRKRPAPGVAGTGRYAVW